MTVIWTIIVVSSIIFSIINGNVVEINNVILTASFDALKTYAMIAANMILWSGILEVCIHTGMIKYLSFLVRPLIKPLFKTKNEEIIDLISANITCNIFALGSASAPFGIKAMKMLEEESGMKKETSDMATLIIINACGFTLIPTSLMALRANFNSNESNIVIFYIIVLSLATTVIMLIINWVGRRWI
jgi:spore maturation protein A